MDMILVFLFHPSSCHETCWKSRHLRLLLQYEIKFELANICKKKKKLVKNWWIDGLLNECVGCLHDLSFSLD